MHPTNDFPSLNSVEPLVEHSRLLDRLFQRPDNWWPSKDYWTMLARLTKRNAEVPNAPQLAYLWLQKMSDKVLAEPDPVKREELIRGSPTYEQIMDIAARECLREIRADITQYRNGQAERARQPRNNFLDAKGKRWTVRNVVRDLLNSARNDKSLPELWEDFARRLEELDCDPRRLGGPKITTDRIDFIGETSGRMRSLSYRSFSNLVCKVRKASEGSTHK